MTAARVSGSSREGSAHPPVPRPIPMREWLAQQQRRRSASFWHRLFGRQS